LFNSSGLILLAHNDHRLILGVYGLFQELFRDKTMMFSGQYYNSSIGIFWKDLLFCMYPSFNCSIAKHVYSYMCRYCFTMLCKGRYFTLREHIRVCCNI